MATKPKATVINFLDRMNKKLPEIKLDVQQPVAAATSASAAASYVVPVDKPKLLLALGSGQTGKSLLLRWLAERAAERAGIVLATLAPNRTLKHYFDDALHPEGNSTSAGAAFLENFLDVVAEDKVTAVLDFPGDDTALPHMLDQGANPVAMLEPAGVEVVALYTLSPRVEDLTTLAQLTAKGFKPKATALILNIGLTRDPTLPAPPEFQRVMDHSAFRSAVDAGAVPIWMPRLYSAKAIEDRQISFAKARALGELGPSDVSRTHHWWLAMEEAFKPIASWLP